MNRNYIHSTQIDGEFHLMVADSPFVYLVIATPSPLGGFSSKWWITGKDWKTDQPVMIGYFEWGVNAEKKDLEAYLLQFWEERIQELAFSSAITGGIKQNSSNLKALSDKSRTWLIRSALMGNDWLKNFNITSSSVIERTGLMYQLLRSMGVWNSQAAIADFETYNFADNWERMKAGEEVELVIKPTIINQRLVLARRAGIIKPELKNATQSGRKTMPAKQQKEFASNNETTDGKEDAND